MLQGLQMVGRRWLLGAVLLAAAGCLSPALPLPPPVEPTTTNSTLGPDYVHLEGHKAEAMALIVVTNNNAPRDKLGVVALADADGNWSCDVWGHKGETLQVTQTIGTQESPSLSFIIR
jgi:hypothetical protein